MNRTGGWYAGRIPEGSNPLFTQYAQYAYTRTTYSVRLLPIAGGLTREGTGFFAMKRSKLIACILVCCLCLGACGSPDFETEKAKFYKAWEKALPVKQILAEARSRYAAEYPEELDLATHPGLVTAAQFTGPVICFGDPLYIPDMEKPEYLETNPLPEDVKARNFISLPLKFQRQPYEEAFFSGEKLAALQKKEIPVIYMVIECTGYAGAGTSYKDGSRTVQVQTRTWRTSFYNFSTGELLAWENAPRRYASANVMDDSYYEEDQNGNLIFIKHIDGRDELDPVIEMLCGQYGG